jgi:hypothetical protein
VHGLGAGAEGAIRAAWDVHCWCSRCSCAVRQHRAVVPSPQTRGGRIGGQWVRSRYARSGRMGTSTIAWVPRRARTTLARTTPAGEARPAATRGRRKTPRANRMPARARKGLRPLATGGFRTRAALRREQQGLCTPWPALGFTPWCCMPQSMSQASVLQLQRARQGSVLQLQGSVLQLQRARQAGRLGQPGLPA